MWTASDQVFINMHMDTYHFKFGRNSQLVWALVLPAFICLIPLLLVLEYLIPKNADSGIPTILLTLSYMGAVFFLTFKWVAAVNAQVVISIKDHALQFEFPVKNFFHRHDFTLGFNEITGISEDTDKGTDFLYFKSKHPHFRHFHVSATANHPDFTTFKSKVFDMEAAYNAAPHPGNNISNQTIYQTTPMKILVSMLLVFSIIFPVVMMLKGSNTLMVLKYFTMLVLCLPLFVKVFHHNKTVSHS